MERADRGAPAAMEGAESAPSNATRPDDSKVARTEDEGAGAAAAPSLGGSGRGGG
jgi:hypothetical protein